MVNEELALILSVLTLKSNESKTSSSSFQLRLRQIIPGFMGNLSVRIQNVDKCSYQQLDTTEAAHAHSSL